MKKMLLAAAVVSVAILSSCTKDYTCTCTSVQPDGTVTDVQTRTFSGTKSGAESDCKGYEYKNGNITTSCTID